MRALTLAAMMAIGSTAMAQEFLVIPDSSNDIINVFDPFDGSLIQTNFIDIGSLDGGGTSTPKDAIQVNNEIWVSDQVRDKVYRFGLGGALIGDITGGMDNIRGMAFANGTVYVSNAGTNNGAPGDAIVTFAPDGTPTGNFAGVGDPFDVLDTGNGIYVDDIDNDEINLFGYDGSFISNYVTSDGIDGIDFPQQMAFASNGNVLVAGFSSPSGIYEYDADGNQVNYHDLGGIRGVYELGNGLLMFTDSGGVHTLDPNTGAVVDIYTDGSSQYINLIVPSPAGAGVLALASIAAFRRRR